MVANLSLRLPMPPSEPPPPRPAVHHGRLCFETRWYGDPDPQTGRRPKYVKRWRDVNQKQAMAMYSAWLARWQADRDMQDRRAAGRRATVADLCVIYLRYAEQTFRKHNEITSHVYKVRSTLQSLIDHCGDLAADQLDMPRLAGWRDAMTQSGSRGRRYINDMLQIVRAMYQWAAERGDVPQDAYQAVASVGRLRKGRSVASERKRVKPVAWATVQQTLPHLSPVVQAMVMTLWHTGMRPEDVCEMCTGDLEQGGDVWLYRTGSHKMDHLEGPAGDEKIYPIGPQAQQVLRPHLKPHLAAPVFQPALGSGRRQSNYGHTYTTGSLRQAIHRACDAAWPPPATLQRARVPATGRKKTRLESMADWEARLGPEKWAELLAWQKAHRWNPNQLRHAKATALRKRYGLEGARLALGHQHIATSEIYADRDLQEAIRIAREAG